MIFLYWMIFGCIATAIAEYIALRSEFKGEVTWFKLIWFMVEEWILNPIFILGAVLIRSLVWPLNLYIMLFTDLWKGEEAHEIVDEIYDKTKLFK